MREGVEMMTLSLRQTQRLWTEDRGAVPRREMAQGGRKDQGLKNLSTVRAVNLQEAEFHCRLPCRIAHHGRESGSTGAST